MCVVQGPNTGHQKSVIMCCWSVSILCFEYGYLSFSNKALESLELEEENIYVLLHLRVQAELLLFIC